VIATLTAAAILPLNRQSDGDRCRSSKRGNLSNQQLRTRAKAISIGVMITVLLATLA
jgi:hypothetical protein